MRKKERKETKITIADDVDSFSKLKRLQRSLFRCTMTLLAHWIVLIFPSNFFLVFFFLLKNSDGKLKANDWVGKKTVKRKKGGSRKITGKTRNVEGGFRVSYYSLTNFGFFLFGCFVTRLKNYTKSCKNLILTSSFIYEFGFRFIFLLPIKKKKKNHHREKIFKNEFFLSQKKKIICACALTPNNN